MWNRTRNITCLLLNKRSVFHKLDISWWGFRDMLFRLQRFIISMLLCRCYVRPKLCSVSEAACVYKTVFLLQRTMISWKQIDLKSRRSTKCSFDPLSSTWTWILSDTEMVGRLVFTKMGCFQVWHIYIYIYSTYILILEGMLKNKKNTELQHEWISTDDAIHDW